uniref:Uncharacterized protein n=1 Tax=Anguilla anguilla TaxID=7936 RepID=A0A0E9XZ43_ANGAN
MSGPPMTNKEPPIKKRKLCFGGGGASHIVLWLQ